MAAATTFAACAGAAVAAAVMLAQPMPGVEPDPVPGLKRETLPASTRPGPLVPVEVLRVIDGDTLEVRAQIWLDQWIVTRVRLRGIDAPERVSRCSAEAVRGEAARQHLARLVAGGPAYLADLGRDKYGGRVLGRIVAADGEDLGRRMLADGHARAYAGRRREPWC